MRRLIPFAGVTLILVLAAPASTAIITVQARDNGFVPATITLNHEDSVTWRNVGKQNHQIVANNGAFASPILTPGKSHTFQFTRAGTFRYHDALHPALRGTIAVKGPPPSVTLGASAPILSYGTAITLSGAVSNKAANETVTLSAQPAGQTSAQVLASLKTVTGGAFSFNVVPQLYTTYVAQWGSAKSGSVLVQVAPRIKLPRPTRGWFHTYVTSATSYAGRYVYLQRLSRFGEWYSVARLTLGTKSGRIFRAVRYLPRGISVVRIFMPADQAGSGYLASQSGSQKILKR
jgi:plastocyanin